MSARTAAQKAVALAEKLGAREAEAYVTSATERMVDFHDEIEICRTSRLAGIGVTVVVGKKKGFFSYSSIERREVESTVKTALSIAKASEPDPDWKSFPTRTGKRPVTAVFDKKTAELEEDHLVRGAASVIDFVKSKDKRLSLVASALGTSSVMTSISNSYGCNLQRRSTGAAFFVRVKAEEAGKKGISDEGIQARSWRELSLEDKADDAADRAIKMMNARQISSRKTSVVISNDLMARVLNVMFSGTINAEAVQRGRSPWIGKIGKQVASDNFNLVDDGTRRAGLGTRAFDDEGIPQKTTPIIVKGVLQSYLYDNYTAAKDRLSSTGNARRVGSGTFGFGRPYTQTPVPAPTNLVLNNGESSLDELITETGEGLYVVDSIGEWLSNPISGLLNATVTNAFEIRKGDLADPVKGVIVSGNFFEMIMKHMDLIGNDIKNSGNVYAPSVRVSEMTVAGE
ncbi:MAG: TldD/PmbA family protein [archaeon]